MSNDLEAGVIDMSRYERSVITRASFQLAVTRTEKGLVITALRDHLDKHEIFCEQGTEKQMDEMFAWLSELVKAINQNMLPLTGKH